MNFGEFWTRVDIIWCSHHRLTLKFSQYVPSPSLMPWINYEAMRVTRSVNINYKVFLCHVIGESASVVSVIMLFLTPTMFCNIWNTETGFIAFKILNFWILLNFELVFDIIWSLHHRPTLKISQYVSSPSLMPQIKYEARRVTQLVNIDCRVFLKYYILWLVSRLA